MVAISKTFSILLLGAALLCANAQKTAPTPTKAAPAPTPTYSSLDMAKVVDCQTQCVEINPPPFGHKPDHNVRKFMRRKDYGRMPYLIKNMQPHIQPCLKELRKLKGKTSKVTQANFQRYVLCNSKTLGKNEEPYFSKKFNWKKAGFTSAQWKEFRYKTLPAFRSALHKCRGGCRRIHFAKKK
ncbi:hypothetical protein DFQ27_005274 [Actinomortierella ambigua]|uniref:Uncharacterized protein n=1 Tax=Actinomortierella ambigua TaxID=1343610 RepID=A0A9P6U2T0_9FUNG|nr:hypothetical protein DFQ27_005274 [Actinomortierella ambigua]